MTSLIYEVFSGVGLCNQLFSIETAIYLANISDRKLILIIKNPLCHCGRATWDYGYIMNFFTNEFLNYLPNGFEVYYKSVPSELKQMIDDTTATRHITYPSRFSNIVFMDRDLETPENEDDIKDFLHRRTKTYLDFDIYDNYENIFIDQSNASRCFYNFYTTPENYRLMYEICKSLKFKDIFYKISDKIYNELSDNRRNPFNVFIHLRFGDYHKDEKFLTRNNSIMLKQIIPYLDGHKTNCISPKVFLLCDNKNNKEFLVKISKYKPTFIDSITKETFDNYLATNNMLFDDFHVSNNNMVNYAIVDMLLASMSNDFIGTASSTFSNYIQFLRYVKNKPYDKYSNITGLYCKPIAKKVSDYDWIRYKYSGGHPVSWHVFWNIHMNQSKTLLTIHGKTDGFGSQLHAVMSLIAYCRYSGHNYIHTPFYKMQHNDDDIPDFPSKMNEFINAEHIFPTINQLSCYDQSIIHKRLEGPFVHGSFSPEYFYTDDVLSIFREMYFSKPKPTITYDSTTVNIALHIRRGDVSNKKYLSRYTPNNDYIALLQKIDLVSHVVHLFSEGDEGNFADILEAFPSVTFVMHLNEEITSTFHHLVMSDILIIAKSSFSYCAGLLNANTTISNIINGWWHKPLKQWKNV